MPNIICFWEICNENCYFNFMLLLNTDLILTNLRTLFYPVLCCSFGCSSTTHQSSRSHHCLWWICVWKTSKISHPHCWPLGQTSSNYQGTATMFVFLSYLHTNPNYSKKMQRSKHCLHCSFSVHLSWKLKLFWSYFVCCPSVYL